MSSIGNVRKSRGRPPVNAKPITVRVPPELLAAVDAWIAERSASVGTPENLTRPEALRQLTAEALIGMGLLKPN
jgi:hypothetical protein